MELLDSIFVHVGLSTENNINKDIGMVWVCWGLVGVGSEVPWGALSVSDGGTGSMEYLWAPRCDDGPAGSPSPGPEGALRPLDLPQTGVVDGEIVRVGRVGQARLGRGTRFLLMLVSLLVEPIRILPGVVFGSSLLCTFELHGTSFG